MNWIRENKFWSSIIGILVLLIGLTGYVYYSTPLKTRKEKVTRTIEDLNKDVRNSQRKSDTEAPIPPSQLIDRLKEQERLHQEDIGQTSEELLELGKGIEQWFGENRDPSAGFFESVFQEEREKINNRLKQQLSPVEQEEESNFLGGGGDEDQQRIDWPDNPTENMEQTQKQFWIIKRLVNDIVSAGAVSFQALQFGDQPDPITVMDGQQLLRRYLVSCDVILPPENVGQFLARLIQVQAEGDAPDLMMHVRSYRLIKRRTTPQILSQLAGGDGATRFTYPLEVGKNLKNWQLAAANLPEDLHDPVDVKLEIEVVVYDPHEPTLVTLMREAGYEQEDLEGVFQPFYTDEEFNSFVTETN